MIARAGALLWPSAAQALQRSSAPQSWTQQTGLPTDLYQAIAANTATILEQVLPLQTLRAESEIGVPIRISELQTLLKQVGAGRPAALGMVIALVLARLPQVAPLLRKAGTEIGGSAALVVRAATEQAKDSLLERLEADGGTEALIVSTELAEAGVEVRRIGTLLRDVEAEAPGPAQRQRMARIRQRLDVSCRTRFTSGLQGEFVQTLEALGSDGDDASIVRLEEAARGLRALGSEARRIGSADTYDTLLRQTTDTVKAIAPDGALTLADRVRLVEILAGSDEAWALLEQAG